MAIFYEDERSPIVAELIRQGFEVLESEALRILDIDETAHNTDSSIALGSGFACIAATAGTLALSGFTFPILLPALGVGLCGITYWNSKIASRDRETEAQFIQDHPEVLGKVQSKINSGAERDTIASAYQQVLRAYRWGDEAQHDRVLGTSETSTQSQRGFQGTIAQDAPRTESTNLAQTEIQPIAAAPSSSVINGVETIAPRDIATDLGNNPQSALIFGTPGAGKGMTISNAIRTLRAKLPNVTVMMVDPKGDPKERGYWESQVDVFESRSLLKSSPLSSAEWMMRCIEKFQNLDTPKLLVWDELYASLTVLKNQNVPKGEFPFPCLTDFQQFLCLNLSLGPSSGIWVWGMSQSANLSDLGLTSGGLSTTRIIALISPDNVGAVEGYLATKAIAAPKGGMETLDNLMSQSPVNRACYDGKTKRWYPVAKLENYSGFDRDNADWNAVGVKPKAEDSIAGNWRETFARNAPSGLTKSEFKARYDLERSLQESEPIADPYEASSAPYIEVEATVQVHPLQDKFDRLEALLDGEDSLTVKELQTKLKIDTSVEAQQLAQMFCMRQKSRFTFTTRSNPNGTKSYLIMRAD